MMARYAVHWLARLQPLLVLQAAFLEKVAAPFLHSAQLTAQPRVAPVAAAVTTTTAVALCSSPDAVKLTCGWASDAEQEQALAGQCPFCGTIWTGESVLSPLPTVVEGRRASFQFAGEGSTPSAAIRTPAVTAARPVTRLR
jgi:hypothetical protein